MLLTGQVIKMIPISLSSINVENGIEIVTQPSLSYKMKLERERIESSIDGIDAVKQAIYKILLTDRYKYEIYNWNYGIDIGGLIGKPKDYVKAVLPEKIRDALKPDDRIKSVHDFVFTDTDKTTLALKFYVTTIYGEADIEYSVNI